MSITKEKALDRVGANEVIGNLTVVKKLPRGWECVCSCGKTTTATTYKLKSGHKKSCGCLRGKNLTTHGESDTRLNSIWRHIIQRCTNPNASGYKNYGGIGVTVCAEWANNFESFRDWALQNGYAEDLTIDRIKGALIYSPSTCKWSDKIEQSRNKRKRQRTATKFIGVTPTAHGTFCSRITVNKQRIRLGNYPTAEEAAKVRDAYILDNNLEGFTLNF